MLKILGNILYHSSNYSDSNFWFLKYERNNYVNTWKLKMDASVRNMQFDRHSVRTCKSDKCNKHHVTKACSLE